MSIVTTKHTPGNWTLIPSTNHGTSKYIAPSVYSDEYNCDLAFVSHPGGHTWTQAQTMANARLIAAAPDLLEACELLCKYGGGDKVDSVTLMHAARAAIVKATGSAP